MFKNPFSFNGRIRRKEYGISFIIYVIFIYGPKILIVLNGIDISVENLTHINFVISIPTVYFFMAQGAKRCHDIGKSGWYQLIPFYAIYLLFADSHDGENEYGLNPKGIGNDTAYDSLIDSIGK